MRPRSSKFHWHTCGALVVAMLSACSDSVGNDSPSESAAAPVVNIPQTPVDRQLVGNCWMYTFAAWFESLHLQATGKTIHINPDYWLFWDWFLRIYKSDPGLDTFRRLEGGAWELETSGWFGRFLTLLENFGFMLVDEFPNHSSPLAKRLIEINFSPGGDLSTSEERLDARNVIRSLGSAFDLPDNLVAKLTEAGYHRPDGAPSLALESPRIFLPEDRGLRDQSPVFGEYSDVFIGRNLASRGDTVVAENVVDIARSWVEVRVPPADDDFAYRSALASEKRGTFLRLLLKNSWGAVTDRNLPSDGERAHQAT